MSLLQLSELSDNLGQTLTGICRNCSLEYLEYVTTCRAVTNSSWMLESIEGAYQFVSCGIYNGDGIAIVTCYVYVVIRDCM